MSAFTSRENRDLDGWLMSLPGRELPPSFSESFLAASAEMERFGNSDAYARNRWDVVQRQVDRFRDLTGEALPNPENIMGPQYDADRARQYQYVRERFDTYRQQNPNADLAFPDDDALHRGAVGMMTKAKADNRALDQQREAAGGSAAAWWGSTLGTVWGGMKDPINLASMALGAPAGAGVLRTMLMEGAANMGAQAVVEAGTFGVKREADPTHSVKDAILSVEMAGIGGAAIGGGIAGLSVAARKLFGKGPVPREAQDALNVLDRQQEIAASSPLPPTVAGDTAHASALQKAAQDLEAGRPVDVQPIVAEARAEAPSASLGIPSLRPANDLGEAPRVYTPSGRAVDVEYRVVEADTLTSSHGADGAVNPAFPADLQPRDRTRLASQTQIAEMAGQLQPERLGRSPDAATGAPIVGPDMVVESGNGRVGAIRSAYEQGGDAAGRYREWVIGQDPAAEGMRNPVLVAVRKTEMDPAARAEFARDANGATAARMSPTELALADARRLDDAALGRLTSGDVTAAGNRGFVRSFLDRLPASERGSLVDASGALNQEGRKRIEGALLGRAYGDATIIGRIVEDADSDIRAIGGALLDVAGPWSKLRAAVARGDLPAGMDVTADLLSAVRMVAEARASGRAVSELAQQMGLFGDDLSPVGRQLLAGLFRDEALSKPAGRARVTEMLSGYLDEASKNSAGARLFGEPLTAEQIIRGERLTADVPRPANDTARPAEEVARAPETQDAIYHDLNRVMADRDPEISVGEAVDPETGKLTSVKRTATDLMDEADRDLSDIEHMAACVFGMAAE